jgi:CRISPR-associated protein Csd1
LTSAMSHPAIMKNPDCVIEGGNFVFLLSKRGLFIHESQKIIKKWDEIQSSSVTDQTGVCMITGEKTSIARIHNSVKGIRTSTLSPNGWTLVGFDKEAFESYGKTQSYNAPVGKYAAFAYTTSLNQLLADKKHVKQVGDTTVVYWSEDADTQSQDVFTAILDGAGDTITDKDLDDVMEAISRGDTVEWEGLPVVPANRFYVLGLSPNAARLSVRFFLRDTFGNIVRNLKSHYERLEIIQDNSKSWKYIPTWALLRETVNPKSSDKAPLPQMSGDVLRSILTGSRYPATLYNQTMLRIRAERKITRGRAAIIKAYLLRNFQHENLKEVLTVALNEQSEYTPYVLGRLFSVLEGAQQAANPNINSTIKDRFFNSACATPAAVFPILMKLSNSHLRKMEGGKQVYWSKQVGELASKLNSFPQSLSLNDQGAFILGYYHQTQKRYEKKEDK